MIKCFQLIDSKSSNRRFYPPKFFHIRLQENETGLSAIPSLDWMTVLIHFNAQPQLVNNGFLLHGYLCHLSGTVKLLCPFRFSYVSCFYVYYFLLLSAFCFLFADSLAYYLPPLSHIPGPTNWLIVANVVILLPIIFSVETAESPRYTILTYSYSPSFYLAYKSDFSADNTGDLNHAWLAVRVIVF